MLRAGILRFRRWASRPEVIFFPLQYLCKSPIHVELHQDLFLHHIWFKSISPVLLPIVFQSGNIAQFTTFSLKKYDCAKRLEIEDKKRCVLKKQVLQERPSKKQNKTKKHATDQHLENTWSTTETLH